MKQFLHFAEIKMADTFEQFDYGEPEKNAAHYGEDHEVHVPRIDLDKVGDKGVPIAMYAGKQDPLATVANAKRAQSEIGSAVIKLEEVENCNHASFHFGDLSYLTGVIELVKEKNPLP